MRIFTRVWGLKGYTLCLLLVSTAFCWAAIGFWWGQRSADYRLLEHGYNLGYADAASMATIPGATFIDVTTGRKYVVPPSAEEKEP